VTRAKRRRALHILAARGYYPGMSAEVLIAGAGPTGLVLALFLARQGAKVRIVDPGDAPGSN